MGHRSLCRWQHRHCMIMIMTCQISLQQPQLEPREAGFIMPVVCPTENKLSTQSSVNEPSVTPDLLLGTHYLPVCNKPPTLIVLSNNSKLIYSREHINHFIILTVLQNNYVIYAGLQCKWTLVLLYVLYV